MNSKNYFLTEYLGKFLAPPDLPETQKRPNKFKFKKFRIKSMMSIHNFDHNIVNIKTFVRHIVMMRANLQLFYDFVLNQNPNSKLNVPQKLISTIKKN